MESVTETPNDYTALLDKLQAYVDGILASKTTVDRKLLDTLLGAINIQVQKEPHSVRKLILDKQLVLPNSISFPPSQVCLKFDFLHCFRFRLWTLSLSTMQICRSPRC